MEAIASGLEAIASRSEAITSRLEATAIRLEAIAIGLDLVYFRRQRQTVTSCAGAPRGRPTMPSVVAFNSEGDSVVGLKALRVKHISQKQVTLGNQEGQKKMRQ